MYVMDTAAPTWLTERTHRLDTGTVQPVCDKWHYKSDKWHYKCDKLYYKSDKWHYKSGKFLDFVFTKIVLKTVVILYLLKFQDNHLYSKYCTSHIKFQLNQNWAGIDSTVILHCDSYDKLSTVYTSFLFKDCLNICYIYEVLLPLHNPCDKGIRADPTVPVYRTATNTSRTHALGHTNLIPSSMDRPHVFFWDHNFIF